jgi:uncharacterized membrane protein
MKTTLVAAAIITAALLTAETGNRKVTQNALSPSAETSVSLGGHKVTIEYNAPSARGRKVEGGLIPYDAVWRLGADSATTLTTETDLTIGDLKVPKGVYTLYLQGGENAWKLIVNKQTGQWGTDYSQGQDLGRVSMKLSKLSEPAEKLKITLKSAGPAATLEIVWGGTHAVVPVKAG